MAMIIKSITCSEKCRNYFSFADHEEENVRKAWLHQASRLQQLAVLVLEFSCHPKENQENIMQAGAIRILEMVSSSRCWNCFEQPTTSTSEAEHFFLHHLACNGNIYRLAGQLIKEHSILETGVSDQTMSDVVSLCLKPLLGDSEEDANIAAGYFMDEVLSVGDLSAHLPSVVLNRMSSKAAVKRLMSVKHHPRAYAAQSLASESPKSEESSALRVAYNLILLFEGTSTDNIHGMEPDFYFDYLRALRELFEQAIQDLGSSASRPQYTTVLMHVEPLLKSDWFNEFLRATHSSIHVERVEAQDRFVIIACVYYSLIQLLVMCHEGTGQETVMAITPVLNVLAFTPGIQQNLWFQAARMLRIPGEIPAEVVETTHSAVWDIAELHEGARSIAEVPALAAVFGLFCRTYNHLLLVLDDDDFFDRQEPFTIPQLLAITAALNTLVYCSVLAGQEIPKRSGKPVQAHTPSSLLVDATALLRSLYDRDCRRSFCPPDLWLAPAERGPNLHGEHSGTRAKGIITQLLRVCPQTMKFEDRAAVFRDTVMEARQKHLVIAMPFFGQEMAVPITIRRGNELEDAYAHLLGLSTDRLRSRWMVSFMNEQGLSEAGLDGGGLLKELLTEVSKKGFDPRYGLFESNSEGEIYPSPTADSVEHGLELLEVVGKIVGKAVFEGVLVEVSLANFFAAHLLGRHSYLDSLPSLDKDLHRNLVRLKQYEGDAADLCLDFTLEEVVFGKRIIHELCPNGKNIPVTNENKLQYVHLVAHWKLNKCMGRVMGAFSRGFYAVVEPQWLQIFSVKELTQLLSGGQFEVDLEDLRRHTRYSGGYEDGSRTIRMFWKVISTLSSDELQRFLRFVTSCPRPPLLGFKHLNPPFTIHKVVEDSSSILSFSDLDRLPTASTCNNMLKLPNYRKEGTMRQKLLYAIRSNAGFELS